MTLEVGTVIKWHNFPAPRFGTEIKPRWFICIGFSATFAQFSEIYLYTTTTQLEQFKRGGSRGAHSHFIFKCNQYKVFEQDCAIDFHEPPYSISQSLYEQKQVNIEVKGKLREQDLRMIYNKLLPSPAIAPIVLRDIHSSYNKAGITNLKKPKSHHKKR